MLNHIIPLLCNLCTGSLKRRSLESISRGRVEFFCTLSTFYLWQDEWVHSGCTQFFEEGDSLLLCISFSLLWSTINCLREVRFNGGCLRALDPALVKVQVPIPYLFPNCLFYFSLNWLTSNVIGVVSRGWAPSTGISPITLGKTLK